MVARLTVFDCFDAVMHFEAVFLALKPAALRHSLHRDKRVVKRFAGIECQKSVFLFEQLKTDALLHIYIKKRVSLNAIFHSDFQDCFSFLLFVCALFFRFQPFHAHIDDRRRRKKDYTRLLYHLK